MLINNYLPKILYLTLLEFIHPLSNMSLELYACLRSNSTGADLGFLERGFICKKVRVGGGLLC